MHVWTVGTQSDARGTRNRLPSRLPQAHQAFCQFCDVCPVRESRESGSCVKVREISGFDPPFRALRTLGKLIPY